jgi:diacylglycerol kinase (ATP)
MGRLIIIANPTAGLGAGSADRRRLLEAARRDLERGGHSVDVRLETDPEQVSDHAEAAVRAGYDAIVAGGGDGTVNAVVNGMMRVAHPAHHHRHSNPSSPSAAAAPSQTALPLPALGVLPLGTGNVFAFNLGIGRTWREACLVLRAGHTRNIDVGLASTLKSRAHSVIAKRRHFLLMAGIGFDAKVVEDTSLRLKYVLRDFAYVLTTLQNVVLHQGTQVTLRLDGGRVYADEAWLVMVGNAASYAWDIKVTTHARLDDGQLDVCLMPFTNKFVSVQQALQILTGQHIERGIARYWKVRSVRVESDPPVPVQLDGDEWAATPVEISILPGALNVLAPPESV